MPAEAGRAADTYVLASPEKNGAASLYAVLPIEEVAAVITDVTDDDPIFGRIRDAGAHMISAAA